MSKENKSEQEQVKAFLLLCLKNWYYFVISMVICIALAFIYIKVVTPVLEIDAKVSLTDDDSFVKSGSLNQSRTVMSVLGMGGSSGGQNVEDESKIMASQGYTRRMIKNLDLHKIYVQSKGWGIIRKQLYDQSPVVVSSDPALPDTLNLLLEFIIDVKKDDAADVKLKSNKKTVGRYKISAFPSDLETPVGKFTISKSTYYDGYEKPFTIKVLFTSYDYMAQIYMKELKIDFEKKNSDLINLTINHENSALAKQILNEIISVYNSKWNEHKDILSNKTTAFIDERLKTVESDLGNVDREIQTFKDKNNLTDIEADVTYYFKMNTELQAQLIEAETQLKLIDIIYDFVKSEDNKYALIPFSTTTLDPSLAKVVISYNEALMARNDWRNNSSITTRAIQSADEQIEAQRNNLVQSLVNIKKGMQVALSELRSKEQNINSRIGNIPSAERQYVNLKREQEIQQTVYLFLVEKREEAMLKATSVMPKLRVIDEPYIVNTPVSPNQKKIAIMVLFFGGIIFPSLAIYGFPIINNYIRKRKKEK